MMSITIARKLPTWVACALASTLLLAGVLAAEAPKDAESPLTWRGCGITKRAFMGACAEAYERETGQKIIVSGGGAALGIRAAAGGSADLGGTCRHQLPTRFDSERGVKTAVIAWDALVAVTHPSNPVDGLSREQLVAILQGQISTWDSVGGTDQRIIVAGRKGNESGVGVMLRSLILNDLDFEFPRNAVLLRSSGPLEKFLERTPGSVAITGVSSARKRALKILRIDGIEPTQANIVSGRYPYFRPLFMAFRPDADRRVHPFLDWILSDRGQAVIARQDTVTLEMGLPLVTKYEHWGVTGDIRNYEQLIRRAQLAVRANDSSTGASGGVHP